MTLVRLQRPKNEVRTRIAEWKPAADITEHADGFTVSLDVPGFTKDDLQVRTHEGVLSVKGERTRAESEDENYFSHYERPKGSFERSFKLPDYIETDKIEASYENGVLTLGLKKKEAAKPRLIDVK
ncbi:Hsp20/alpha crystallin family protein [Candidatus Latescibacterota bacterium]